MNASTFSAISKPAIPGKISWKDGPSIQQNFSLPSSIIYYISKNPSTSTQYLKLAQSCKYFFEKLPILIAKDFFEEDGETKICANNGKCEGKNNKCYVKVDITKLSSSIWITNGITLLEKKINPNILSLISPKIYQCDIVCLDIDGQNIIFNDFKFLAATVKTIYFNDFKILFSDGSNVTLDAILEALPHIKDFVCYCNPSFFGPTTLKNIANLKNLSKLIEFTLYDIPEIPNVQDFLAVIKELKDSIIYVKFVPAISDGFKNQLNALIDTVIQDEIMNCLIEFDGQDPGKKHVMGTRLCLC